MDAIILDMKLTGIKDIIWSVEEGDSLSHRKDE